MCSRSRSFMFAGAIPAGLPVWRKTLPLVAPLAVRRCLARARAVPLRQAQGLLCRADAFTAGEDLRALHGVFKLADVARASDSGRAAARRRARASRCASGGPREGSRNGVPGQDVARRSRNARDVERKHVEPVIEVFAEASRGNLGGHVAVAGGEHRMSSAMGFFAPTRSTSRSCSTRSSPAGRAAFRDLVGQDGAAIGLLELAGLSVCAP